MKYTNNNNFSSLNSTIMTENRIIGLLSLSMGAGKFTNDTQFVSLMNNFVQYVRSI